jgi:hypothetical protein
MSPISRPRGWLIAALHDELTRVQRENASLRHQLDLLCQRLFGKKSRSWSI